MNWLFKIDKLPYQQSLSLGQGQLPAELSIVDESKRRWRIEEADHVLVIRGGGENFEFIAHGIVESVEKSEEELDTISSPLSTEEPTRLFRTKVRVASLERLEEDRTLVNFMFSLEKVYNFSRPWKHFRHRGGISDIDFTTLLEGRIAWDRSMFYGLLRHLPEEWRDAFELQVRLDSLASSSVPLRTADELERKPIPEIAPLFDLLERTAVTPLVLSHEVSLLAAAALPDEQFSLVMGPSEPTLEPTETDLIRLTRLADRFREPIEAQFVKIRDVVSTLQRLETWEGKWLPHHW